MKYNFLLILILVISGFTHAQIKELKGTVKDKETNFPIMDVSISTSDLLQEVLTDDEGNFTITNLNEGDVLLISAIGYETMEYQVGSQTFIQVELSPDAVTLLEDAVVIGYGTQTRKEVTGAVSVISSETIEDLRPIKTEQALQGTVAGVYVSSGSGSPGANLDIRIRGVGTNGNNAPTVIIDGFVGDLSTINPNDIESMTVLKDAQAAIYGTIGANGVILVTTKKGRKNQKTSINYNTYYGFQETSRKLPLLNSTEYALILNEAYANAGQNIPFPEIGNYLGVGTDWQEEVFQLAPIMSHELSIAGGGEKMAYTLSASNLDQDGIVGKDKSGFRRNTARVSLSGDLSDKWTFNTNLNYIDLRRKTLSENALGSVLFNALNAPPTLSVTDDEGAFTLFPIGGLGNEIINPLAQIADTYNEYAYRKISGTFDLNYEVIEGLKLTGRIGFNSANDDSRTFFPIVNYGGKVFDNPRSRVTQSKSNFYDYSLDFFGEYNKSIADHNMTLTLGTTYFRQWSDNLTGTGYDVPGNAWENADIGLTTGTFDGIPVNSSAGILKRMSYFGRFQYNFKDRYLFSAMIRRDESTNFGPANSVAWFPSVTAGWIVSEESFFDNTGVVNFLKLRGSWGKLGNDLIGPFQYRSLLSGEATYVFNGSLVQGVATGAIPNEAVGWEESEKFDVGIDINLFNNKLSIVADYFIDTRHKLLIPNIPVTGILGAGAPGAGLPTLNAGGVENKGFEFAFNYKDKFGENWGVSLGYNVTFLDNKVIEIENGTGFNTGGAFGVGQSLLPSMMDVGNPLGYFYGYQTAGIFQNQQEIDNHADQSTLGAPTAPGDLIFVDQNGDGVIDSYDRVNIGDPIADVTMGLNLQLNFKNVDLMAFAYASIGNDMVRNYERTNPDVNRLNYVLDRWHGEGTSNSTPRVTTGPHNNNVFSDYFVEDASFLRIQNIQLGYTFGEKFTNSTLIKNLRIYAAVNNVYTFTKYRGYDPAANQGSPIGAGIDYGFYPLPRTYMLGLNVKF